MATKRYTKGYSFSGYQANNPAKPLPAQRVDAEFLELQDVIGDIGDGLDRLRRDDGNLANGVVGLEQLTTDLRFKLAGLDGADANGGLDSDVAMNGHKITGLSPGTAAGDAVSLSQLEGATSAALVAVRGGVPGERDTLKELSDAIDNADTNIPNKGGMWSDVDATPVRVRRFRDRVFVGNAVLSNLTRYANPAGTNITANNAGATWAMRDATLSSISEVGGGAVIGMSRVSDGREASTPAAIGVGGFVINDGASTRSAWALYADIQHQPVSDTALTFGIEIAAKNKGSDRTSQPYQMTWGVHGIWLAGGGDNTYGGASTNPSNTGIAFIKNSNTWNKGIVFACDALTGTLGAAGDLSSAATAIEMAKNHQIRWVKPDGSTGAAIRSIVETTAKSMTLLFIDDRFQIAGPSGVDVFDAIHTSNSAVNGIEVKNAVTANPPSVGARGSDTNIDLALIPKGTGGVLPKGPLRLTLTATAAAAGTTQATATAIAAGLTFVTSGTGGVVLRAAIGERQEVFNRSGAAINVYPPTGAKIEALATNAALSLANGEHATFILATTTQAYQVVDTPIGTAAGTVAAGNDSRITGAAQKASNLSDLADAATARSNLGLGGAAVLSVGTGASTVAAGNDSRITGAAQKASNLSDLADAATARTNLGLGGAAVLSVGTGAGTVAAGNDGRITGAVQQSSFATLVNYADDTAAAAGGVAIGGLYRTGSAIKVRVA